MLHRVFTHAIFLFYTACYNSKATQTFKQFLTPVTFYLTTCQQQPKEEVLKVEG